MPNAINESPPVVKPARWRWLFRLSLRSLFIILTLAAVWLAVVFQRCREQRAAVARINELGGFVRYSHELDFVRRRIREQPALPGPTWMRRLLGPEFFQTVNWVRLSNTAVTDADLRIIGKLRGVAQMELGFTNVTDAGLYELRRWRQLRSLDLNETKVSSDGLRYLASMPDLAGLQLWRTAVGDKGMAYLRGHSSLGSLGLGETRVTSQGIQHLHGCLALSDLSLSATPVDDAAVETLSTLHKLTDLQLTNTRISGAGLLKLCEALPDCHIDGNLIDLDGKPDKKISWIGKRWAQVLERIVALDGEDYLKLIDFSWTNIQDEQLASLHSLQHVQLIDLRGSEATESGAAQLRKALPHCEVRH